MKTDNNNNNTIIDKDKPYNTDYVTCQHVISSILPW